MEDHSGAHAVFAEQRSSALKMTAAVMVVIARLPGCAEENVKETRTGLNHQKQIMTQKPVPTSGGLKETSFVYRHHVEPRVLPYVPKEETFEIPHSSILT